MKKILSLVLALVMVLSLAAITTCAEEPVFLPGGGSNIVYVITPATSNVFFATEAEVAKATAEELGYEVKTVSHDDDASKQLEAIETAIADKAAFTILDNAGADATIEAMKAKRARDKARDEAARQQEAIANGEATDWKEAMKEWQEWEEKDHSKEKE